MLESSTLELDSTVNKPDSVLDLAVGVDAELLAGSTSSDSGDSTCVDETDNSGTEEVVSATSVGVVIDTTTRVASSTGAGIGVSV